MSGPVGTAAPTPAPIARPGSTPRFGEGTAGGGTGGGFNPTGAATGGSAVRAKKISKADIYWLGALGIPWHTAFLPEDAEEGYTGEELDVGRAVRGEGGESAWKLEKRPTIVTIYDPSSKQHIGNLANLETDPRFVAGSRFFNLVRVDVRSIRNKKIARKYKKGPHYLVYSAGGSLVKHLKRPPAANKLVAVVEKVIAKEFRRKPTEAINTIGRITARKGWVEDRIAANAKVVVCPDCGKKNEKAAATLAELKKELAQLEEREKEVVAYPRLATERTR